MGQSLSGADPKLRFGWPVIITLRVDSELRFGGPAIITLRGGFKT